MIPIRLQGNKIGCSLHLDLMSQHVQYVSSNAEVVKQRSKRNKLASLRKWTHSVVSFFFFLVYVCERLMLQTSGLLNWFHL